MPVTLYRIGVALFASTSIFPILILPWYSVASSSTMGAIARQGPHHVAQKSTSTGVSDFSTSWSKFESVTSIIPLPAIIPSGCADRLRSANQSNNSLNILTSMLDARQQDRSQGLIAGLNPDLATSTHQIKSALNFSVQDASAALPQNCQTTNWIVGAPYRGVNVTSVMHDCLRGNFADGARSNQRME